ncbi:anti-adapter protein IraP [Pantoea rodasii]|uniref:Anti-adapter protein IraP n=1 Tax=Pantoea rodasii TaxID=1076549 RepID=A0A2M9WAE0_9GAMM|nr:anti-adapter protein IraP [Pantoea rodasii]ORM65719.1 anti-adapter protein IraP [Pantoea rodasii]PJZ04495.1 anti-adapter protein IraP [Pantoea rodasii]
MKNLIAELLLKLAEKEEESKELVVQVEALEIVLTAMLRKLDPEQFSDIAAGIATAMPPLAPAAETRDTTLLRNYVEKLLNHPRV